MRRTRHRARPRGGVRAFLLAGVAGRSSVVQPRTWCKTASQRSLRSSQRRHDMLMARLGIGKAVCANGNGRKNRPPSRTSSPSPSGCAGARRRRARALHASSRANWWWPCARARHRVVPPRRGARRARRRRARTGRTPLAVRVGPSCGRSAILPGCARRTGRRTSRQRAAQARRIVRHDFPRFLAPRRCPPPTWPTPSSAGESRQLRPQLPATSRTVQRPVDRDVSVAPQGYPARHPKMGASGAAATTGRAGLELASAMMCENRTRESLPQWRIDLATRPQPRGSTLSRGNRQAP